MEYDNKPIELYETKPVEDSSSSKPNYTTKECNTAEQVLTGMLAKTFKELEDEAPFNPEIREYLATFHESVRNALLETDTPTGAIPFRSSMTLQNIGDLLNLMPDLYDYLKVCYSAIESSGDIVINNILDAAHKYDYTIIKNIGEEKCSCFIDNYIAFSYYNSYLPGYKPIAFSIDDWYPPQKEFVIMPRKNYWWYEMNTLTWNEFHIQYPDEYEKI